MSDEWHRWYEVTSHVLSGRRLFRSSAPNYDGRDTSQRLTDSAVAFLSQMNIDTIVSFNQHPYTDDEQARLLAAGIFYLHLPVKDFHPPTIDQLQSAIQLFSERQNASMLVHCGFGHGRTGTGVTALQLFATRGESPPEADWRRVNHVEKDDQIAVLRELRDRCQLDV